MLASPPAVQAQRSHRGFMIDRGLNIVVGSGAFACISMATVAYLVSDIFVFHGGRMTYAPSWPEHDTIAIPPTTDKHESQS